MLDNVPDWLAWAAKDKLNANKSNVELRKSIKTLQDLLVESGNSVKKLSSKYKREIKRLEQEIQGLIIWALEEKSRPVQALGHVSTSTMETILKTELEKPKAPAPSFDSASIKSRGEALELELDPIQFMDQSDILDELDEED